MRSVRRFLAVTTFVALLAAPAAAVTDHQVNHVGNTNAPPMVDLLVMRVVDVFLGFPPIVLALAIMAALGPGPVNLVGSLAAVFWAEYARVVRAVTLRVDGMRSFWITNRPISLKVVRMEADIFF